MVFFWRYGSQAECELGMVFWIALVQPVLLFVPRFVVFRLHTT